MGKKQRGKFVSVPLVDLLFLPSVYLGKLGGVTNHSVCKH